MEDAVMTQTTEGSTEVADTLTQEVVEEVESKEPEKPTIDWEQRAKEAEARANDIAGKFEQLMASVSKLVDAGLTFGGSDEPTRHNPPKEKTASEKSLDQLFN